MSTCRAQGMRIVMLALPVFLAAGCAAAPQDLDVIRADVRAAQGTADQALATANDAAQAAREAAQAARAAAQGAEAAARDARAAAERADAIFRASQRK